MAEILLACRDCGQIHHEARGLRSHLRVACARCGAGLVGRPRGGPQSALAYAIAAFLLFLIANFYPIFNVEFAGSQRADLIVSGAVGLVRSGGAFAVLGVLVGMLSIVVPGVRFALIVAVLTSLKFGSGVTPPWLAPAWKTAVALRSWAMLDVYLLGAFVAYTRLEGVVDTSIGVGGYALAALVLVQALLQSALGRRWVWDHIADPHGLMPKIGEPWVLCPDCDLVAPAPVAGGSRRCPRCAGRLEPRRPGSLAAAAALTLAAYVLYLPANLLPVMTILRFGQSQTNTIVGGVAELAQLGMWPLALLVLFASIIVPVLKLLTLSWFLVSIRLRSRRLLHQRGHCYRLIEFIGRWSTIDVFMISILAALLQFGALTTVFPDGGIVSFAAVVVLTMIATRVFDPRLMWDAAGRAGR